MDIYEDQFDFHTYCLRRYSLNTYTRLLNYENGVYNQNPFVKACTLLIRSLMEYTSVRLVEVKECLTNQKSFLLNSFYVSKSSRRRKQKIYELRISVKWRKRNGKSNRNQMQLKRLRILTLNSARKMILMEMTSEQVNLLLKQTLLQNNSFILRFQTHFFPTRVLKFLWISTSKLVLYLMNIDFLNIATFFLFLHTDRPLLLIKSLNKVIKSN